MTYPWYYFYTPDYEFWHSHLESVLSDRFKVHARRVETIENLHDQHPVHHWTGSKAKAEFLIQIIKQNMGRRIVFSDATMYVNADKINELVQLVRDAPHGITFTRNEGLDEINIGFMVIDCSVETLNIWEKCRDTLQPHEIDQSILPNFIKNPMNFFSRDKIVAQWPVDPETWKTHYESEFLMLKIFTPSSESKIVRDRFRMDWMHRYGFAYQSQKKLIDRHVQKLRDIVINSGERCEGNVFWAQYAEDKEVEVFLPKRQNLFNYSQSAKNILEIGFNAGHSCLLYLLSNPDSKITLVDIGTHSYMRECFEYLDAVFPGRLEMLIGDSVSILPQITGRFDLIHIDGGHDEHIVKSDILNVMRLSDYSTVIISDDDDLPWIHTLNKKYFLPIPDAYQTHYQFVGNVRTPEFYDFIEIGTSDFDTEVQTTNQKGVSVEPIQRYLDALPNKPGCVKVCAAISTRDGYVNVYSVAPEHLNKFPDWARGCNSINNYHPKILPLIHEQQLDEREIISIERVPVMTFSTLVRNFNIKGARFLKIDTEGHDINVLNSYLECIDSGLIEPIERIMFESNDLTSSSLVDDIIERLQKYGYHVVHRDYDTIVSTRP